MDEPSDTEAELGFLLHVFHRNQGDGTVVFGVGRLASGETFAVVDGREPPCLYARSSDLSVVRERGPRYGAHVDDTALSTMDGESVVRVSCSRLNQARQLADDLHAAGLRTYEADVAHSRRFLMDRGLRGPVSIRGQWRPGTGVRRVYIDPQLAPAEWEPGLAVLALDIETDPEATRVLAASLVGSGSHGAECIEEIHVVGDSSPDDPAELSCYPGERELLEGLAIRLRAIDPDILTGWNLVDFDLPVLERRFRASGLPFNLGRSNDDSWYREGDVWGGSRMVVYGRQVLDAMHLSRACLARFDDYRLDTVARAILGRGKTLSAGQEEDHADVILKTYEGDRAAFCEYCLEDSRLVRDILEAEGLIQLSLRRSVLTGLPLERAWGSVAAFDFLYISELRRRGMVAPTTGVDRSGQGGAPGGLVMPAAAGLYRHVFVFDFKSLYPSIIRTFNIDPWARIRARTGADADAITAPNGATFVRETGILPGMLEEFFASRDRAKDEGDAVASYAYKIVMNSFYGVLATDACRFAEGELAGAITEFGHYILRWARSLLEDAGKGAVLYGDTDSLFVDAGLSDDASLEEALDRGSALCAWINEELTSHVEERYGLASHLELEFEKYYRRFFLPPMRGDSERGRAKGYAGLRVDAGGEEVEIIGMEAVRRDWTDMAHDLQRDLLDLLLHDAPGQTLEERVIQWIDSVRAGERDGDLVYRKSLRKSVDEYSASSPPHVVAARLLPKPSGLIHYAITADGPQPVGRISAPLDYEHYIEKQIKPIVRTISQVCDLDVEAAVTGVTDLFRSRG